MPCFLRRQYLFVLLTLTFALTGLTACSNGGSNNGDTPCEVGQAGCECYGNGTCNTGLDCVAGACTDPNAPEDAGTDVGPPPDSVLLTPLRVWETDPSAVAMLFTAEDAETGVPYNGFTTADFRIVEDGEDVPSEAVPRILPSEGLRVYVTLMLDMSSSTQPNLAELQAGARDFIDQILVEQNLENVYVGIQVFDGSQEPIDWQLPVQDPALLKDRISALTNFGGPDPGSTNLHGAVRQGVQNLQARQQQVIDANYGGVVTAGYMVLFTDGGDTAGREDAGGATSAVEQARVYDPSVGVLPTVQTLAVALRGQDYDPQALSSIVGGAEWVSEADIAQLQQTFEAVGGDIAARVDSTYLLAYCSASRAGEHTVSLSMRNQDSNSLGFDFSADGFSGGCTAQFFDEVCDGQSCGGFNCGACDDSTEVCDGAETGRCVSACIEQNKCDGETITNALGYEQTCSGAGVSQCGGTCIDTSADDQNCGACGNTCSAAGSQCVDGVCVCDGGGIECGGECVDAETDNNNCGACGNVCPSGATCTGGVCDCGGGETACAGTCVDLQSSNAHCGACGVSCGADASCESGQCVCDNALTFCDGTCVDLESSQEHCAACGAGCSVNERCSDGVCQKQPQVSAGELHTCGVKADGTVACWGRDNHGQSTPPGVPSRRSASERATPAESRPMARSPAGALETKRGQSHRPPTTTRPSRPRAPSRRSARVVRIPAA